MKFAECIMRPGKVLYVGADGTIKASAPALFSEKDTEKLPPIYPLMHQHSNSYSQPIIGDEVWVINVASNPRQLYWLRKDDIETNNKGYMEGSNIEIIAHRELDGGINHALLYYSDETGWVLSHKDTKIVLKDSNILLGDEIDQNYINITPSKISLGSKDATHPVPYGDDLQDILMDMYNILKNIEEVAAKSPYTSGISAAITSKIDKIGDKLDVFLSDKIMVE